ncbi:MAG: hypothetical protein HKO87_02295 [Acidimicrobiia bacterium]|nr:hypothetical protein [Acidimicrobiia bacterium]
MIAVLVIAGGIAAGSPLVVACGLLLVLPVPMLALVMGGWGVFSWRRKRSRPDADDVAELASALASELGSGQTLGRALEGASRRAHGIDLGRPVRLAAAGRPSVEVAEALQRVVPVMGAELASAYRLSAASGARSGPVFSRVARAAADHAGMAREVRLSSVQARASAAVVAGAPVVLLVVMGATGMLAPLWSAGGLGAAAALVGIGLVVLGVAVVWSMSRRAQP